jgi:RNA pseudouridylate synthase
VLGQAGRTADRERTPPYRLVFEDDSVVVVEKPAGLVTAPTPESDRGDLFDQLRRRDAGPVFLVHRLDLPTSGLLVFARTPEANRVLGAAFARHDVEREYVAVVAGTSVPAATIDRPIQGRRAVTHVSPVESLHQATLLSVRLETGRSHQIRIHLAGEGHPVLGDSQHGGELARRYPMPPPRIFGIRIRCRCRKRPRFDYCRGGSNVGNRVAECRAGSQLSPLRQRRKGNEDRQVPSRSAVVSGYANPHRIWAAEFAQFAQELVGVRVTLRRCVIAEAHEVTSLNDGYRVHYGATVESR